ncbi:hypothetical protein PPYR_04014 [Photinus pyralis]|uniref:DDE Tnp4 domain-containing protein n=1 Tax=Photinus pyralis TaxID=7054 RepID=A0A5N4AX46_PHOPY|nr:hypothetical protein PPYR_04014 [Photinus pyralis]
MMILLKTVTFHRTPISNVWAQQNFLFLATGESFVSLSFAYRISDCYISKIVRQVLKLLKKCLVGTNIFLPHFLIGDEAFGIDSYMMKPYPRKVAQHDKKKQVFNYRICRARRVSENAFGLLSQIFRIFYTPISINPDTCTDLIMTACCLHNLLREEYRQKIGSAFPNHRSEK